MRSILGSFSSDTNLMLKLESWWKTWDLSKMPKPFDLWLWMMEWSGSISGAPVLRGAILEKREWLKHEYQMYIYQNKWTKWLSRVEFSQRFCQGIHKYTFRYILRSLPLSWCLFFLLQSKKVSVFRYFLTYPVKFDQTEL